MKHAAGFLTLVEEVMPRIREIGAEDVAAMQARREPFVFIDVREESEWAAGHAAGAVHLGRGILERDIEARVPDKQATLVLCCGGGYRSALAADTLQRMGYADVRSMAGGWRAWREKGLPAV